MNKDLQNRSQAPTPQNPPDVRRIEGIRNSVDSTEHPSIKQALKAEKDRLSTGVTIKPASHPAKNLSLSLRRKERTGKDILAETVRDKIEDLIQSSFSDRVDETYAIATNGLFNAAMIAYSRHYHLYIRPEDVWLAILTQLSSYINAHAEELRGSFVAHEGKKELVIVYNEETPEFAQRISTMIQDNVVDPELREWIMPAFSTTTEHDTVVASIVMMASMQAYFAYTCYILCGLPSVTLVGEKADYELILRRLDKLRSYGDEPTKFADLLTPVLKRFILSFDAPESEEVIGFWNNIYSSHNMGSGPNNYSGWITAFAFWNKHGRCLHDRNVHFDGGSEDGKLYTLDDVTFHSISESDVPPGYCTVPVKIVEHGKDINATMLAGSVAMQYSRSGQKTADSKAGHDTLQPRSAWWIYEKGQKEHKSVRSMHLSEDDLVEDEE